MKSIDRRTSRYVQGGTTEVFQDRLGFWTRDIFEFDSTDEIIILDARYHKRPWLLANDKYRDVSLTWFILQYNSILDVNTEFVDGAQIRIPIASRLFTGMLTKTS